MTLNSKLSTLRDTLTALTDNVYHYTRPDMAVPYILWQEDMESDSFYADVSKAEQIIHGTIDYYTKTEFDATVDSIQSALDENKNILMWRLNSVQYEDDTNLIHYEWEFEM